MSLKCYSFSYNTCSYIKITYSSALQEKYEFLHFTYSQNAVLLIVAYKPGISGHKLLFERPNPTDDISNNNKIYPLCFPLFSHIGC